jgi:sortase B
MEQSAVSKTDLQPSMELPDEEVTPTEPALATVTDPDTGETVSLLPEFAQLYTMNNHIVGWISIADTDINYPVMQVPDSRDYYLYKGFDRAYSRHGCIYVREECDVFAPSDNITIYGHRMGDGTMFNDLHDYADPDFYEDHRYILFNTLTERHTYEIFAVFKTTATIGEGFQYHHFVDADSAESFNSFVNTCKRKSFYDTGITPQFGDKMITLSTCEYSQENGRLVVVAVRVA